jgi:hypothetical protein
LRRFAGPIPGDVVRQAMDRYGSDKLDLRVALNDGADRLMKTVDQGVPRGGGAPNGRSRRCVPAAR